MTKIKLCGLSRPEDIQLANRLKPEYIGFVFAPKSKRHVTLEKAMALRKMLCPETAAVGVFVNEDPKQIASLLRLGIIDIAQLHGSEDEAYIGTLRALTDKPIIKAFRIDSSRDITDAENSTADYILLDSGTGGTGTSFDWTLLAPVKRPYFLAGGLTVQTVADAVRQNTPYAVDVSSGIETDGVKDPHKMNEFVRAVRSVNGKDEIE